MRATLIIIGMLIPSAALSAVITHLMGGDQTLSVIMWLIGGVTAAVAMGAAVIADLQDGK